MPSSPPPPLDRLSEGQALLERIGYATFDEPRWRAWIAGIAHHPGCFGAGRVDGCALCMQFSQPRQTRTYGPQA